MTSLDQVFQNLESSEVPLPEIKISGSHLIQLLESSALSEIQRILYSGHLQGVAFVAEEDDDRISSLAAFVFKPGVRDKNLGWHLDAFPLEASKRQRLTALYSPPESFSSIPTYTAPTAIIDQYAEAAFPSFGLPDEVVEHYSQEIIRLIGKGAGYYTLLQNIALADRDLNQHSSGHFFAKRDEFTRSILDDPAIPKGRFETKPDSASLLFFPNGLGPNRDVAHTRFHRDGEPRNSQGSMYNLCVEDGGTIHTLNEVVVQLPSGIRHQVTQFLR